MFSKIWLISLLGILPWIDFAMSNNPISRVFGAIFIVGYLGFISIDAFNIGSESSAKKYFSYFTSAGVGAIIMIISVLVFLIAGVTTDENEYLGLIVGLVWTALLLLYSSAVCRWSFYIRAR